MTKIFIDSGHGGSDPGAIANGILEKDINLSVSLELEKLLINSGFDIMMTRQEDIEVDLTTRCNHANNWGADMFISIHHNAGNGDGYEIIHTIHSQFSQGDEIANSIGNEFLALGQNLRRIYARESTNYIGTDYYTVIQNTNMPAIITEFAFIDNAQDVLMVDSIKDLQNEAYAIYKGICNYYQVQINRQTTISDITDDSKIKILQQVVDEQTSVLSQIKRLVQKWI